MGEGLGTKRKMPEPARLSRGGYISGYVEGGLYQS